MKKILIILSLIILPAVSAMSADQKLSDIKDPNAEAKKEEKALQLPDGLSIEGFFDVVAANYDVNPNIFSLGEFELDISHTFNKYIKVTTATVINVTADQPVELADAFVDFSLMGSNSGEFSDDGLHIRAGKFDLMFGNDWNYSNAKDRTSVTVPLTVSYVLDNYYNDLGAQFIANYQYFNATLYIIKGSTNGNGMAYAARVAATPVKNEDDKIEIGLSYKLDLSAIYAWKSSSYALDFEMIYGPAFLQAEYYIKDKDDSNMVRDGYQVTAGWNAERNFSFLPLKIYLRFDAVRARENLAWDLFSINGDNGAFTDRIGVGLNFQLLEHVILKFEYSQLLVYSSDFKASTGIPESSIYGQVVAKF